MNKYKEYVLSVLSERELLEQLTEEAAEMQQAAMKLIRADGMSNNPTPVTAGQARTNLQEEFSDILMVAELLELIDCQNDKKWQRWAERLGYKDVEHDEESELTKAAEMIKTHCVNGQPCETCPLFDNDRYVCKIRNEPYAWGEIKSELQAKKQARVQNVS